jgi:DNA invertase Pin-like site-specific DNA recombinase
MKKIIGYSRISSIKQLSDNQLAKSQKELVAEYVNKNRCKLIVTNNDRFCRKGMK